MPRKAPTKTFTESKKMADKTVAAEIMRQLGGGRFILMTGARHFVADDDYSLSFKIPRSNGIQAVTIKLNGGDTYDMEFCKINKTPPYRHIVATEQDVYFDELQKVFTHHTGLATSL